MLPLIHNLRFYRCTRMHMTQNGALVGKGKGRSGHVLRKKGRKE